MKYNVYANNDSLRNVDTQVNIDNTNILWTGWT